MKKFVLLAVAALFLFASCAQVITSVFDATLVLTVARPSRTLLSQLPAVHHYSATLTREGASAKPVTTLNSTGSTSIVVSTGTWTVVVAAFDSEKETNQIGVGTATIVVTTGENAVTVTVSLTTTS